MVPPVPQSVRTPAEFLQALALRLRVFCVEQKVPPELERDDADAVALHLVVRNTAGIVVATGRLLRERSDGSVDAPGAPARPGDRARIGRMAVRADARGTGLGGVVLEALELAARQAGMHEGFLHAQLSAERFYLRHGWIREGEEFEEAGIRHVGMSKSLQAGRTPA